MARRVDNTNPTQRTKTLFQTKWKTRTTQEHISTDVPHSQEHIGTDVPHSQGHIGIDVPHLHKECVYTGTHRHRHAYTETQIQIETDRETD